MEVLDVVEMVGMEAKAPVEVVLEVAGQEVADREVVERGRVGKRPLKLLRALQHQLQTWLLLPVAGGVAGEQHQ